MPRSFPTHFVNAVRFHLGSLVNGGNESSANSDNLFITSRSCDYRIENNAFGAPTEYHVVFGEDVLDHVLLPGNFLVYTEEAEPVLSFYDGRLSPSLGQLMIEPTRRTPSNLEGLSWIP